VLTDEQFAHYYKKWLPYIEKKARIRSFGEHDLEQELLQVALIALRQFNPAKVRKNKIACIKGSIIRRMNRCQMLWNDNIIGDNHALLDKDTPMRVYEPGKRKRLKREREMVHLSKETVHSPRETVHSPSVVIHPPKEAITHARWHVTLPQRRKIPRHYVVPLTRVTITPRRKEVHAPQEGVTRTN
jgi:hypothetical protein